MAEEEKSASTSNQPGAFEDIKLLYKAGGNIKFLMSLPSLTIPAILEKLTETLKTPIEIWKLFIQTFPISLSVAVIGVGFFRDRKHFGFFEAFVIFSLTLGATSWIGNHLNLPGTVPIEWWKLLLWPIYIILSPGTVGRLIDDYYDFYGYKMFFSSVLVGVSLAYYWGKKILPRFEDRTVVTQADREKFTAALRDMQEKRGKEKDADKTTGS